MFRFQLSFSIYHKQHHLTEMEDSTSLYSFGSRGNLSFGFNDSLPPDWLVLNAPVLLNLSKGHTNMKQGVVRYIGKTEFSTGTWVGVELDLPCGCFLVLFAYVLFYFIVNFISKLFLITLFARTYQLTTSTHHIDTTQARTTAASEG